MASTIWVVVTVGVNLVWVVGILNSWRKSGDRLELMVGLIAMVLSIGFGHLLWGLL